jgi:hypothetical protein
MSSTIQKKTPIMPVPFFTNKLIIMAEARKRQQYEMSGVAVGMLLKPSKGIRWIFE